MQTVPKLRLCRFSRREVAGGCTIRILYSEWQQLGTKLSSRQLFKMAAFGFYDPKTSCRPPTKLRTFIRHERLFAWRLSSIGVNAMMRQHVRPKKAYFMSRVIAALLFLLLPITAQAQEAHRSETVGQTPDERVVWALEHDYWRFAETADHESYLALWDDRFVGWPGGSELPTGKLDIDSWIRELHVDPTRRIEFWIKPKASMQFGDVVVVHYLYGGNWLDAKTGQVVESFGGGRITHTWQRRGESWQIITGMSAG